jgi:hypothetical protein
MKEYYGGCHCGAVSFKFQSNERVDIWKCNCSICNAYDYGIIWVSVYIAFASFLTLLSVLFLTETFQNDLNEDLPN